MEIPEQVKEDYPPEEFSMSGWFLAIMIAVALFIPFLGPLLAFLIGLLNFRRTGGIILMILSVVIVIVNIFYFPPQFVRLIEYSKVDNVKIGLGEIQDALNRYRDDHNNTYPTDIHDLIQQDYITGFHLNPYSLEAMKEVPFQSDFKAGDFTYVPVLVNNRIRGYYLMGYSQFLPGEDVNGDGKPDHVVEVLSSYDSSGQLPPLADLLNQP
jgi:hypothetical protein